MEIQPTPIQPTAETIKKIANQLRIHSIRATTQAGSGHPTSCCSAADLVATLFFSQMRFDPKKPKYRNNDRFILSKGHAAPLLYAVWAELGHFPVAELDRLRRMDSVLEGHPTARLDFVDVATGSLGQGLSAGVGMAIQAQMDGLDFNTYVLMGDGEISEGSVWEAASLAGVHRLNNLIAIVDVNRLGQSQPTAFGHQVGIYRSRFESFGWRAIEIDGHDVSEVQKTFAKVGEDSRPLAIIARTIKGKGISFTEDQLDWHGKHLNDDQARQAIETLQPKAQSGREIQIPKPWQVKPTETVAVTPLYPPIKYPENKPVATRKAFGNALARLGEVFPDLVVIDGDVENSTYTQEFGKQYKRRFVECFISEQNMVGIGIGLGSRGKIPFVSTFAAFFSRAADQLRMASLSFANLKIVGTHAGVSIGEDGPSQMGLEDLALMRSIQGSVVFSPCDAMSTERLVEKMAENHGIFYLRAARPETPIIYSEKEKFEIGDAKILRHSEQDQITVIATGITVYEALEAFEDLKKVGILIQVIDAYCIKPFPRNKIAAALQKTQNTVITVEDHYTEGGLGDTVAGELSQDGVRVYKLAVKELPHSGKKDELLSKYKIDSQAIQDKVKEILNKK